MNEDDSYVFDGTETQNFEVLPEVECRFEVLSVARSFSRGDKTQGCQQVELGMLINDGKNDGYVDVKLTKPDASVDPKTAQFLKGKLNAFLRSAGAAPKVGESIPWKDDSFFIGLRGWLKNKHRKWEKSGGGEGVSNDVAWFCTDKPMIPRNKPQHVMPTAADDFN